jgi:hypothetical protein
MDDSDKPVGVASGCLVRFEDCLLLLSVCHATGQGRWAAEMRFYPERDGTELQFFGDQWSARHLDPNTSMHEELDFSFTEVPQDFVSIMQERNAAGEIVRERQRHTFEIELQELPTVHEVYAFTGRVRPAQLDKVTYWSEPTVYPGLRYERTDGYYHVFSLPVPHPGHDAFRGCSGAPIVDRQGRVVALVCSGDVPSNTITGISLHHLATAIRDHVRGGRRA